jgi:hypothetical protein
MPGVIFQIGKTKFRVFEEIDAPEAVQPPGDESWQGILKSNIPRLEAQNTLSMKPVLPFTSILELHFLEGLQADQVIVLGYGPRIAGSAVLDIELLDPQAPEVAFELQPLEDGRVLFQTQHPELVLLNDNSFSAESLKAGDQIRVGTSLIEVRFIV